MSYEYPSFDTRSATVRLSPEAEEIIARYGMDRDAIRAELAQRVMNGANRMEVAIRPAMPRFPRMGDAIGATAEPVRVYRAVFTVAARWSDGSVEFTASVPEVPTEQFRAQQEKMSSFQGAYKTYDIASARLSIDGEPVRVGDMVSINARGEAVRSFSFNTASGDYLDALALASFGVTRRYGETDASLRARLMPPSRDPNNRRLRQFIPEVMEESHERFLRTRDALKQRLRDTQARNIARGGTNPLPLDARPVPLCAERPSCARVCESSDARCLTRVKRRRVKRSDRV